MKDVNKVKNDVLEILQQIDDEPKRRDTRIKNWRFGVGTFLFSLFLLLLSLHIHSMNRLMIISVSILVFFIGVYFIDKGNRFE